MAKLKLDFEITRKPDPPGFVCSLCDQPKRYWEAMYQHGATNICSHCHLSRLGNSARIYDSLGWPDQLAILIARTLLKTLNDEIKDGQRYGNTIGQAGPSDVDCGINRGPQGPESGENFKPRRARESRTGPTSSPRSPLRRDGPKVPRWSRIAAAEITSLKTAERTKL